MPNRTREEEARLVEQYLQSLEPSTFDKVSGAAVGVGSLIDMFSGNRNVRRGALPNFERFISGQTERREGAAQQTFLNRLREASAGRETERLRLERDRVRQGQERVDIARQAKEDALIGKFSPNPDFISDLDQSLIDQRRASAALSEGRLAELGKVGGQQKIPMGSLIQSFLGGRQQIVPGTEQSLFPQVGQAPLTPQAVDSLGAYIQQLQRFGQERVFPDTSDINTADFLPAEEIPASAKAQIGEGLRQRYGSAQWDTLSLEQKEAIIREQFFNPR